MYVCIHACTCMIDTRNESEEINQLFLDKHETLVSARDGIPIFQNEWRLQNDFQRLVFLENEKSGDDSDCGGVCDRGRDQ